MSIDATLARHSRDARLYLFLGLANWFIFLDHIPNNLVSWITQRNFGFSGAADVFVFISGYTAALLYAPIMLERGTMVGATRVLRRAWQLYAAFIVLYAIYVVLIGDIARRYAAPDIIYQFNMAEFLEEPVRSVAHGLLLQSKALNLDLLQLYVVLMAGFPLALWLLLRAPNLALTMSLMLYIAARQFEWTLPTFPEGNWHVNPFCWQLPFVLGAWCALGGAQRLAPRFRARAWVYIGGAYLLFALVLTLAGRFPALGHMLPDWLLAAFIPNDRTNLGPARILHFVTVALFATRLIAKEWPGLKSPLLKPLIICGQQSLAVFCTAVFLSFAGHLLLVTGSGSFLQQILVSLSGVGIMTLAASYVAWSRRQDQPHPARLGRTPALKAGTIP
jgi:hypothetical protein